MGVVVHKRLMVDNYFQKSLDAFDLKIKIRKLIDHLRELSNSEKERLKSEPKVLVQINEDFINQRAKQTIAQLPALCEIEARKGHNHASIMELLPNEIYINPTWIFNMYDPQPIEAAEIVFSYCRINELHPKIALWGYAYHLVVTW